MERGFSLDCPIRAGFQNQHPHHHPLSGDSESRFPFFNRRTPPLAPWLPAALSHAPRFLFSNRQTVHLAWVSRGFSFSRTEPATGSQSGPLTPTCAHALIYPIMTPLLHRPHQTRWQTEKNGNLTRKRTVRRRDQALPKSHRQAINRHRATAIAHRTQDQQTLPHARRPKDDDRRRPQGPPPPSPQSKDRRHPDYQRDRESLEVNK